MKWVAHLQRHVPISISLCAYMHSSKSKMMTVPVLMSVAPLPSQRSPCTRVGLRVRPSDCSAPKSLGMTPSMSFLQAKSNSGLGTSTRLSSRIPKHPVRRLGVSVKCCHGCSKPREAWRSFYIHVLKVLEVEEYGNVALILVNFLANWIGATLWSARCH